MLCALMEAHFPHSLVLPMRPLSLYEYRGLFRWFIFRWASYLPLLAAGRPELAVVIDQKEHQVLPSRIHIFVD